MRKELLDLVQKTILYKYDLPNNSLGIEKTIFSTANDKCFSAANNNDLAEIIYNAVIEYSFNEFEITDKDFSDLQIKAFEERIRYDENATDAAQLKYGFFGEVILYAVLKTFFGADCFISKGYFYSPIENSEAKGYDAYHLIEKDSKIQLWFGETKFHINFKQAVKDVLDKITTSLSDTYLKRNLLAIRQNKDRLNIKGSVLDAILQNWDENPRIVIIDELKKYNIELVYPVVILYQQNDKKGYDDNIKAVPEHIKEKFIVPSLSLTIPYSMYFILIPVENVRAVKTEVLKWIKSKKQLL